MSIIFNTLRILYRIWFYFLVAFSTILVSPLLIITTLTEKWYPYFFRVARVWSKIILFGMGFPYRVKQEAQLEKNSSYIFIANHTSMTDIMLMFVIIKDNPFVFVGKKELAKIPIFGFFYKRTSILVDRQNTKSRQQVFNKAQARLNKGRSICIFPEGGVPDNTALVLDKFKDGAFRLAIDHQIPIVPITFFDNKKRFPYDFFKGGPGIMRAHIHPVIPTAGLDHNQKKQIKEQAHELILQSLLKDQNKQMGNLT